MYESTKAKVQFKPEQKKKKTGEEKASSSRILQRILKRGFLDPKRDSKNISI
jgi:hypothetical protein